MLSPFSKLVKYLRGEKYFLLESYFAERGHSAEQINLLKQKGFCPYSYFDSLATFCETQLPPQSLWSNTLQGGGLSVSKNQYNHAVEFYAEMNCASLGDYDDVYLATDVLLLASVFEAFREVCYEMYGLECACYFTASDLSVDAFLISSYHRKRAFGHVAKMIRGVMSSIYTCRFFKANNKYLEDYNPEEPSSYLLNIDANNFYGEIMKHLPFP